MKYFDNIWETSTTTGTAAYVLAGARAGFKAFGDKLANNEYCEYYARSADGLSWERCWGQYSSGGNSLTRNLIESSTGALINWAAGTRELYQAPPAKSLNDLGAIYVGAARPAWLLANRLWLKTGVAPLELYFFDGADDILLGKLDATANGFLPPAFIGRVQFKDGGDVASAAALTLGDGNLFNVTGTTAITSIGAKGVGTIVALRFAGALTLTHHATDLVLPMAANIVTAAGDVAWFAEYAAGDWRCLGYLRANGKALAETVPVIIAAYESAEQTLTLGTAASVAHGLGAVPEIARLALRCKTAELGYSVGDEVEYVGQMGDGTYGASYGATVFANATNVGFVIGATGGPSILNKSTGVAGAITLANWKGVLRAWI